MTKAKAREKKNWTDGDNEMEQNHALESKKKKELGRWQHTVNKELHKNWSRLVCNWSLLARSYFTGGDPPTGQPLTE